MTTQEAVVELQALVCEREGMVAANMQREAVGMSMAYDDAAFFNLADRMRLLI